LQHKRNAFERAVRQPLLDLRFGSVKEGLSRSVQLRIDRFEPLSYGVKQLKRSELTFRNERREPEPVVLIVLGCEPR
jgi:hypothetical protein